MTGRQNAAGFPWREAMRFGFGVLRLSPDAFWAMTPRELAAAVAPPAGTDRLDRNWLADLERRAGRHDDRKDDAWTAR